MNPERIQPLNDKEPDDRGSYVLYWMQQSQRAVFNHALEYAARIANDRGQGLVVGFGLMADYPEANARHFAFMLDGLADVGEALRERGIKFVMRKGSPDEVALDLARQASVIVCDRGYLRHQRAWRKRLAEACRKRLVQVESDVVVPVNSVSDKAEYAARTIRPKIMDRIERFSGSLPKTKLETSSVGAEIASDLPFDQPETVLADLDVDRSVGPVDFSRGGTAEAQHRLTRFIRSSLKGYEENRSDPSKQQSSGLSPYLHFGQISPVEIVRKVRAAKSVSQADKDAFIEELVVRRELAANFVQFTPDYDKFDCLPDWAKDTLDEHKSDERPARYTRSQLEAGKTGDRFWNAAMAEMRETGSMHNYMRMYWGKKILEWCNTPKYAFETALYLNNKYFLDGRDCNSFANVAWIFGLHDRPWQEREVFGKVRYMNAKGLTRKFDMDAYVERIQGLADR